MRSKRYLTRSRADSIVPSAISHSSSSAERRGSKIPLVILAAQRRNARIAARGVEQFARNLAQRQRVRQVREKQQHPQA